MTEQELYEKIRSSAEEIEVPESLLPENMKKKLDAVVQQDAAKSQDKTEGGSSDNGIISRFWFVVVLAKTCRSSFST